MDIPKKIKMSSIKYFIIAVGILVAIVALAQTSIFDLGNLLNLTKQGYAIVIGKAAKVSDVLGAIDLATRLSESYVKEQAVEGRKEYEVRGWEARLSLDSNNLLRNGAPGLLNLYDSSSLPQLRTLYVRNGTQSISDVAEKVEVVSVDLGNPINANQTLQLELSKDKEYIRYYVDLRGNEVYANGDKAVFVKLRLAGKDIVISKIEDKSVTLFEGWGPDWAKVGDVINVGDYKVRIDRIVGWGGEATVWISVLDANNNVVDMAVVSPGQAEQAPQSLLKIVVTNAYGEPYNGARLAVGKEIKVTDNTRIDNLFKWYVNTTPVSGIYYLSQLGYSLQPNETVYVRLGEEIAFPNNYFKLKFLGLTASDRDYLATFSFKTVSIDVNKVSSDTNLQNINSTALEISGVQFVIDGAKVVDKIYAVQNNSGNYYLIYYDSKTGNYSTGSIFIPLLGANVSNSTYVSIVSSITGEELFRVRFDTSNGVVDYMHVSSEYELAQSVANVNSTWLYTNYGHKVFKSSDGKELRVSWIPIRVYARIVLGDVVEKRVEEGKVVTLESAKLKVPVAYFDDEELLPDTPLVVVGGPVVNKVAAEVLGIEYGNYSAAEEYFTKVGAKDKAIVVVKEYRGRPAIVVAGWRAEDTRLACRVLQKFDEIAALRGKSAVIIGGSVESPEIRELPS
jgi:hypothetical protein